MTKTITVSVHSFVIGDVEDPDLYAAEPILTWQKSDSGDWIMKHAVEQPEWVRAVDHMTYGFKYNIKAKLSESDYVFWKLKYT
jgi:hypothetical protein